MSELVLRKSTIGYALSNAIQELVDKGQINSPKLCDKIMEQFDKSIVTAIETNANLVEFKFKGYNRSFKRVDDMVMMVWDDLHMKRSKYVRKWKMIPPIKAVMQRAPSDKETELKVKKMKSLLMHGNI
jgi:hypothetical protein